MTDVTVTSVAVSIAVLAVLIVVATAIRRYVPWLRRLFIPSAVTAGFVGLLLGPQVVGNLTPDDGWFSSGLFPHEVLLVWDDLPGLLINVVFAAILLGKTLPSPRAIWRSSAPPALFGATLSSTFTELGFDEGTDLALGLATLGLVAGILVGTVVINRAVKSDQVSVAREEEVDREHEDFDIDRIDQYDAPEELEPDPATSPLTLVAGAIALAIGIGWLIQQGLMLISGLVADQAPDETLIAEIPLFPFTIVGGALLQIVISVRGWSHLIPRKLVNQVAGVALDLLIAAAIATLSLTAIGGNIIPFTLMVVVGLAWSLAALVWLAQRFYGERWFEPAIGDFGQSSGTVASGFLLIGMSDPQGSSGARESYGYKQLLYEPFLGGGFVTALSLPIINRIGATWALVAATAMTLVMVFLGTQVRKRLSDAPTQG